MDDEDETDLVDDLDGDDVDGTNESEAGEYGYEADGVSMKLQVHRLRKEDRVDQGPFRGREPWIHSGNSLISNTFRWDLSIT